MTLPEIPHRDTGDGVPPLAAWYYRHQTEESDLEAVTELLDQGLKIHDNGDGELWPSPEWIIMQQAINSDEDCDHHWHLRRVYEAATDDQRAVLDATFAMLCGYTLTTVVAAADLFARKKGLD